MALPPPGYSRPSQLHLPNGLSGLVELLQHTLYISVDLAGAPIHSKCAPATRRGLLRPQGFTSAGLGSTLSWIPNAPSASQQLKEVTRVQTRVGAQLSTRSALEQQKCRWPETHDGACVSLTGMRVKSNKTCLLHKTRALRVWMVPLHWVGSDPATPQHSLPQTPSWLPRSRPLPREALRL